MCRCLGAVSVSPINLILFCQTINCLNVMLSFIYFSKWQPFIEIIKLWTSEHMVCLLCFDRDLKPTNVLLDEDDRPVLMDLGSMNCARIEVRAQGLWSLHKHWILLDKLRSYNYSPYTAVMLMKLGLIQVRGTREAMTIQDWAAQRCTISYRAPELFNVESHCIIDERTDIWVKSCILHPFKLICVVHIIFWNC